ncbi:SRPBCC family protein [Rhodococcus sp. HM1]|uniref:SRPBCC family protein n=1 Tax=unclassified Rhodococcus (in: high G+C Gram-positive bacteria) TaxID=192944 RepID=UPI0018CF276E|nr:MULTISPECIES: SRPBCC family protein [unclassified Rhodococcus (in: high G+C Gram-positive bacteria)]MBH0120820.1 SRPBCC family protein [Rhodococcus sp. CX]MCK8672315.1 SRPBCC family protein [Rhodococcus sp. HM1]
MQLEHQLSVPAPIDEVWSAVLDPEKVAPCMPGATLTGVDGDTFTGTVKVKIGPVALTYKGTGEFVEKDEAARKVVLLAKAKDSRGNGTVDATITITLTENGENTDGTVNTDLSITGKPAQFGRGMISDVGGKIIEQFAECLSKKLGPAAEEPAPATEAAAPEAAVPGSTAAAAATAEAAASEAAAPVATPEAAAPAPAAAQAPVAPVAEAEPLDLMQYARGSAIKRIGPAVGAAALLVIVLLVLRRLLGSRD